MGTRSDSPVPRLSKSISRENDASRSRNRAKRGSREKYSMCETQPMTKNKIEWRVADHLVGYVYVATSRIKRFWNEV